MPKPTRIKLTVEINLAMSPGLMYSRTNAINTIQILLDDLLGSYQPAVYSEHDPTKDDSLGG